MYTFIRQWSEYNTNIKQKIRVSKPLTQMRLYISRRLRIPQNSPCGFECVSHGSYHSIADVQQNVHTAHSSGELEFYRQTWQSKSAS